MPRNGRKPGKKYGAGERANRRTRLDQAIDPALREILHTVVRGHVPLTRAVRGYERPDTWGEPDAIRRAAAGDVSILHDLVSLAIDELREARRMVVAWSQADRPGLRQLDDPGRDGQRERLDVVPLARPAAQDRQRLPGKSAAGRAGGRPCA